jgi:hypothetical protein
MEILRNQDYCNSANVLHYGRGYEMFIRAPVAVLRPECATQTCELVEQGRARVDVSPQDISRVTIEKRYRVSGRKI